MHGGVGALAFAVMLVMSPGVVSADDVVESGDTPEIELSVRTSGGAPPLLRIEAASEAGIAAIRLDSGVGRFEIDAAGASRIETTVTPFHEPGEYRVRFTVLPAEGSDIEPYERELEIGFIDFRFGRDNFNFGNNNDTVHGSVKPYSETLFDWLGDRGIEPDPVGEAVLLDVTYDIFKGAIGRCYSFAASQERYMRFPDSRPEWYDEIYDIHSADLPVHREMNRLQNDIVFNHFVAGDRDVHHDQTPEELAAELDTILRRVAAGEPVTVSYLAPERHHAMLVYGYMRWSDEEDILLLTANNWGREQESNLESTDAEYIRVVASEGVAEWVDAPVRAYDRSNKLFVVDVREEAYEIDGGAIEDLIERRIAELFDRGEALIVVENVSAAAVVDAEGRRTGRVGHRTRREIDEVEYRPVSENALFRLPADFEGSLVVEGFEADDAIERGIVHAPVGAADADGPPVNIWSLVPGDEPTRDFARVVASRRVRPDPGETLELAIAAGQVEL